MKTLVLLLIFNPFAHWHWKFWEHHVYSTGDITIAVQPTVPLVEQPPYTSIHCFGDDTGVFLLEPDDSIGMGYTCDAAIENGKHLDPPIRWWGTYHPSVI